MIPFAMGLDAAVALFKRFRGPVSYIAAAIALLAFLWLLKGCYDDSLIDEYEGKAQDAVATASASASAAATEAVTETINEVEKGNADARKAANGSNDPLGTGLRELRANQVPARPATR